MKSFCFAPAAGCLRYSDLPGSDPAILFLHGLGGASVPAFLDAAVRPPLCHHRRLLVDLFGHGFSDAPSGFSYRMEDQAAAVLGLVSAIGVSNVQLVGHSMGGAIAILVASEDGGRFVRRLIVAEPNLDPGPGVASGPIASFAESEFVAHGHRDFVSAVEERGFHDYAATLRVCDSVGLHRSAVSLIGPRQPTYRERLLDIGIPRIFLGGEKSHEEEEWQWLRERGVAVHVIPNAGHTMMTDNPEGFGAALAKAVA
jgi:pimeloyl-ACP methyl ester carboxylesterase